MNVSGHMEPRVVIAAESGAECRRLELLVSRNASLDHVATCNSGEQAIAAIGQLRPDLAILDTQLAGMTGFDVLDAVGAAARPAVIFTSACERFAIQAFETNAVDYLLKPFSDARFATAIARALERLGFRGGRQVAGSAAHEDSRQLVVPTRKGCRVVNAPDIDWVEACNNYVRLHVAEQTLVLRAGIASLAQRLPPPQFMRIHRSTVVNVDRIRRVETHHQTDFALTLDTGVRLTSGRAYRNNVRAFLQGV